MTAECTPVVESVYLLDDLSSVVDSQSRLLELPSAQRQQLLRLVRATALDAARQFPLGSVAVELLS